MQNFPCYHDKQFQFAAKLLRRNITHLDDEKVAYHNYFNKNKEKMTSTLTDEIRSQREKEFEEKIITHFQEMAKRGNPSTGVYCDYFVEGEVSEICKNLKIKLEGSFGSFFSVLLDDNGKVTERIGKYGDNVTLYANGQVTPLFFEKYKDLREVFSGFIGEEIEKQNNSESEISISMGKKSLVS